MKKTEPRPSGFNINGRRLSLSAGLREVLSNERVLDTIVSTLIQASGYTLTLKI
ncbi:MAG: hypothetical protein ACLU4N_02845 [Butyricimonas faecihominis]